LTVRDSQALGLVTKRHISVWQPPPNAPSYDNNAIVTVQNGATLKLESNVGHIDSLTGTINRLNVAVPLSISGPGYKGTGALRSVSGINTYDVAYVNSPTQNSITGTNAPIGSLVVGSV